MLNQFDQISFQANTRLLREFDSPDKTWEIALELAKKYPQVQIMRRDS